MEDKLQISYQTFQREYSVESEIGKGGFGMVCRIYHPRTKSRRALKTIRCTTFDQIRTAEQEIQIMTQLQHPHILTLFEFYQTCYRSSLKGETTYFGMVLQLGQSSLQQSLKNPKYLYSIAEARRFLAKLIEVGAFLQSKELVHCDIKPANIIIFGPALDFKIGDFGLSCNAGRRPNAFVGSPYYCSPKLKEYYYNPKNFAKKPLTNAFKDDVYSVGLTVNEVLLKINFDYKSPHCRNSSPDLCQILQQMLRIEQKYRPTFQELMSSEFMRRQLNIQTKFKQVDQDQHFKNIVLKDQISSEIQMLTIKKEPNMLQRNQLVSKKYFKLQYSIRTLAVINHQYVLIGTDDGLLVVYDRSNNRTILLNLKHGNYVSCITSDRYGNFYTAGADGTIYCIAKSQLLQLLDSKVQTKYQTKTNLYGKVKQKETYELEIGSQQYEVIPTLLEKKHISYFYCISKQNFAVGYADGSVLVVWDKKQSHFQNYLGVITNIKDCRDKLYVSFYSGHVISFNLKQFKKDYKVLKFKDTVIELNITALRQREGYTIWAFTCNGTIQKLQVQQSGKTTHHQQNILKDLIAVNIQQQQAFLLSEDGVVLHDNEEWMRSEVGESWCCMSRMGSWLVLGSFGGDLMLCEISGNN